MPQDQFGHLIPVCEENIQRLERILRDIRTWPDSWKGDDQDLVAGHIILRVLMPYLLHLLDKGRTKSTVRKHADYLWALGGEIIRDLNEVGFDQKETPIDLMCQYVDSHGGPYWRHAKDEHGLQQYDSVCRSLYKFLQLHSV